LNWQDNSDNEIGFDIQRKKQGQADFEPMHAGPANLPVWDDAGAEAGIPHSYRIRAYNMVGTSDFTNEAIATIPAEPPYQPMNPAATWDWTHHAVYVTWDDMCDNEQFFIVERKQEGFLDWDEVVQLGQNWEFHYDDGVNGDTYYRYRIKAMNPLGHSYSEEVQVYIPTWRLPQ
jgi:titin